MTPKMVYYDHMGGLSLPRDRAPGATLWHEMMAVLKEWNKWQSNLGADAYDT